MPSDDVLGYYWGRLCLDFYVPKEVAPPGDAMNVAEILLYGHLEAAARRMFPGVVIDDGRADRGCGPPSFVCVESHKAVDLPRGLATAPADDEPRHA